METVVIHLSSLKPKEIAQALNDLIGNTLAGFGYPEYLAEAVESVTITRDYAGLNYHCLAVVRVLLRKQQ